VHYSKAKVDATLMQLTASGSNFTVSITNSEFICEETLFFESKVIEDIAKIESKPLLSPSAINAKGLKDFVMETCSFQQCYNALKGGVLNLQDSVFNDTNSVYKCKKLESLTNLDNSAFRGGVIKASSSSISITGSTFQYNYAFEAGVIQVDNDAKLLLTNIRAESNYA
jgi:hypothetical protein